MFSNTKRKGFTLIELLIVVVIIGILAAIAIPKFANTKDKAKLSSVKSDVRNLMNTMEGIASGNNNQYRAPVSPNDYALSAGNTLTASDFTSPNGYSFTVTNASITGGQNNCSVAVGAAATPATDGVITCAAAAAP
jgi:prepilin-type N-terminal cleavage/methylation domain-containing protein